MMISLYLLAK